MMIVVIFLVVMCYKLILFIFYPQMHVDVKRYLVISMICIIFLLHPTMTLESLTLFECVEVDTNLYMMKGYLEYKCYSGKHFLWIFIIAVPTLIVWVIGMPVFALIMLIKRRHHLEEIGTKKYLLLLYQGLRPQVFYWEFVNIIRKI